MINVHITDREIVPERQVILEERRMRTDNVPSALLDEAVREQLYGRHRPYSMPVIGYDADIRKLGLNDLAGFYKRHYAPNNAVLIVAGDTTTEAVRALAERYYGPIANRRVEPRRRPDKGGDGLPQKVIRADARVAEPRWSRLWIAPSYRTGETQHAYALQVLARLFGGSETSRLWRRLVVETGVALSCWAGYSPSSLGLTSFDVGVHPARSRTMADVEAAVAGELKRLLDDGVAAEEVERAQNQLLAGVLYSRDSLASGPRIYATALTTGSTVADADAWPQRIAEVTPAAVLAAARHVWRDSGAVTALLTPAEGVR